MSTKGVGLLLMVAGFVIGYLTLTRRWPVFLLALLYPQDVAMK